MASKRIDYIDYMKGLSIIWVVWYHTVHPWFVDFSFRIPLFFLVSGIFFKVIDIQIFAKKKFNQLVIPFFFFYAVYFVYLMAQFYGKYGSLETFNFNMFFEIFHLHKNFESFTVNPPLWFICALINLQLMLYALAKLITSRTIIFILAIFISLMGVVYIEDMPTPFMFGRSLRYMVYYAFGFLYGKDIIKIIESQSVRCWLLLALAIVIFSSACVIKSFVELSHYPKIFLEYIETFALIIALMYLFKYTCKFVLLRPLKFFGANSYVVLGIHEIYHTLLLLALTAYFGEMTISMGIVQTVITLLLLYPTIKVFNKYIPHLIGKKEVLSIGPKNVIKNKASVPDRVL